MLELNTEGDFAISFSFSGYVKVSSNNVEVLDLRDDTVKAASSFKAEDLEKLLNDRDVILNSFGSCHLEACTMGKEAKIENRMIGDKVVQRHLALDFDKSGMICLIRRLQEFNANDHFDFSECELPEGEFAESVEESEVWSAARNLGSTILEVLGVEGQFNY